MNGMNLPPAVQFQAPQQAQRFGFRPQIPQGGGYGPQIPKGGGYGQAGHQNYNGAGPVAGGRNAQHYQGPQNRQPIPNAQANRPERVE